MTDVEFFTEMVMPAVREFSKNPGDIRLGTQACQWLQNMSDHYFRHNQSDSSKVGNCTNREQFRASLRSDWPTDQVMAIANGTKHAKKRFDDLTLQAPGVCGVMRAGFPLSSEPYVFVDDDYTWLLCDLTEHVAGLWKAKLGIIRVV